MALSTAFTDLFSVRHPIALARMGGSAGGALAAAGTGRPWGVGFQSWAVQAAVVERALAYHPVAVMLPRKRWPVPDVGLTDSRLFR